MKYRICGAVAALVLVFHLFMIFVYLGPPNLLQLHVGELAFGYVQNIFYQNWHLFSPNPGISSVKFAVRCADDEGHWSSWKDPFAGALEQHKWTRITGYSKVLMLFGDIAQSLKKELSREQKACPDGNCPRNIDDALQEKPKELARRFALDYCLTRHPEKPKHLAGIQFKVLEFFPVPFTKARTSPEKWDKVVELPFEPIYRQARDEVRP